MTIRAPSSASWGKTDMRNSHTEKVSRHWDYEVRTSGKAQRAADWTHRAPMEAWPVSPCSSSMSDIWVTCSLHTCLRDCTNEDLRSVNTTEGHFDPWLNRFYSKVTIPQKPVGENKVLGGPASTEKCKCQSNSKFFKAPFTGCTHTCTFASWKRAMKELQVKQHEVQCQERRHFSYWVIALILLPFKSARVV